MELSQAILILSDVPAGVEGKGTERQRQGIFGRYRQPSMSEWHRASKESNMPVELLQLTESALRIPVRTPEERDGNRDWTFRGFFATSREHIG